VTTPEVDRAGVRPAVRLVASGAAVVILVEAALALLAVADAYRRPERWTVPTVAAVTVFALLAIPVLLGLVHTLRGGLFDAP
jgi:hypothetical protein